MSKFKLIRYLSEKEITEISLLFNVLNSKGIFSTHTTDETYQRTGPLREGFTVWLRKLDKNKLLIHPSDECIQQIINEIAVSVNSTKFGRAYLHILPPGCTIHAHADTRKHSDYFDQINRYQIYLSIPHGVMIEHNGPSIDPYTVIQFDHQQLHKYVNHSSENLYLVVFDIYN